MGEYETCWGECDLCYIINRCLKEKCGDRYEEAIESLSAYIADKKMPSDEDMDLHHSLFGTFPKYVMSSHVLPQGVYRAYQ